MTDNLAPRRAAVDIIDAVIRRRRTLDAALDTRGFRALEGRDRSFAHALAMATLRHRGFIAHVLKGSMARPLPAEASRTRFCLFAGIAQILFLDVPDHAAVATTVALIDKERRALDRRHKGLANAVLRRVANERSLHLAALDEKPSLNLAPHVKKRWQHNFGAEITDAIARALRTEPQLDLSPRDGDMASALAERLGGTLLPGGSIRLAAAGDVAALPGFSSGEFWVQDAAAALPARLFDGHKAGPILDLCAAPGGKTLQLAARGWTVTAVDRSADRLKLLGDSLARTGLEATAVVADALVFCPPGPMSAILLDAPCSASGTARRHPEVLWHRSEADILELTDIQSRLLDHAASLLAPEGILVYCVCSLEPAEGEVRIDDFLARHPDFRRKPVMAEEIAGLDEALLPTGDIRTRPDMWAGQGGLDGFFISRLQRGQG